MITIHAGGDSFQATGNHPFYVLRGQDLDSRPVPADVPGSGTGAYEQGRWVEARDLRAGDVLMVKGGAGLLVGRVASRRESDTDVYNLDVDGPHNYAVHAEGILVHNKGSASVPPVPFVADHPFLFLIRDFDTGNILFMGRLVQPG
jgi:intein/homing endonuclease